MTTAFKGGQSWRKKVWQTVGFAVNQSKTLCVNLCPVTFNKLYPHVTMFQQFACWNKVFTVLLLGTIEFS